MAEQNPRRETLSQLLALFEIVLFIVAGLAALLGCLVGRHPPGIQGPALMFAAVVGAFGVAVHVLRRRAFSN